MDIYNLTLSELESMPTLSVGQADDLKYETDDTRVWLSRCGIADGEPFNNKVTVEKYLTHRIGWAIKRTYEAK